MPLPDPALTASGTLVHIGAGSGERLAAQQSSGLSRIVLVEPDPELAAALIRQTRDEPRIEVLPLAVAGADGEATLEVMNFPDLSSLRRPNAALRGLFPGLRARAQPVVEVLSPATLLARLGPLDQPLHVILEAAGAEQEILTGWKAAGALAQIDRLELRCGEEPFHDGAAGRAALESWLVAEGFALDRRDQTDPDWPVLHLRADAHARAQTAALTEARTALQALESRAQQAETALTEAEARAHAAAASAATRLAALEQSLAEAQSALAAKDASLSEAEARISGTTDRATSLDTALAEAKIALATKATALAEAETKLKAATERAATLDKTLAETKAALAAKATALTDAEAKLKAATDRSAALDRTLTETKAALASKTTSLAEAEKLATSRSTRIAELDKTIATLRNQLSQANEDLSRNAFDLRSTRNELGLALRLQTTAQSELQELRQRYEAVQAIKQEQDDLLRQLTPRLHEAARQLQNFALAEASAAETALRQQPSKALPGKKARKIKA
ncbi:hypothetical protein KM031_21810 (plasmid) [Gemmobacter fulvus]|uniref:Methyltransferase FkbM domain-containing protein n=1 Tax=Gemmobacter fulvus TaxID=2840474 RepID=A0A975PCI9_9RHOB|nr:hypothetical protein [Gemmobacter fulvus]MBT9247633.1 hypothetical protein [Gemmobacter fulvus]QWK93198.1 hypothetical protein KM031_21810 [Gemmobacter fulvus]